MDDGVGARLREVRTRRKIDLESVEAATKIRVRYLRAIENGEWDVLPGDAYAGAFVRTYANHLGLDGARLAEDYRRERGSPRPAERLPRVEHGPRRRPVGERRRLPRIPPRVLAAVVSLVLVAALLAIGLSSGDNGSGGGSQSGEEPQVGIAPAVPVAPAGGGGGGGGKREVSVSLVANAEVWVCLLDAGGQKLIAGQILEAGAEEGPYRSGSFTVALGNGEVTMTVNGQQASIPQTSGPVGFSIGADGAMRELSEGERPTCT